LKGGEQPRHRFYFAARYRVVVGGWCMLRPTFAKTLSRGSTPIKHQRRIFRLKNTVLSALVPVRHKWLRSTETSGRVFRLLLGPNRDNIISTFTLFFSKAWFFAALWDTFAKLIRPNSPHERRRKSSACILGRRW
jgi:hypothetical protein